MSFRRAKLFLFLVMATLGASFTPLARGQSADPESVVWNEFVSVGGGFRVQMPDRPRHETIVFESGKDRLLHNIFTVERGAFSWMVDYADLPREMYFSSPTEFLHRLRDHLIKDLNGTLRQEKALSIEDHPGLDMTLGIVGGEARIRLYLVKGRLFQLLVTRLDSLSKSNQPIEKFLDSFKLLAAETAQTG